MNEKYSKLKSKLSSKMVSSIEKKHKDGFFVYLAASDNSAVVMAKGTEFVKTFVFISISGLIQTVGGDLSKIPPMVDVYKRIDDDLATVEIFLSKKDIKMKTCNPNGGGSNHKTFSDFL